MSVKRAAVAGMILGVVQGSAIAGGVMPGPPSGTEPISVTVIRSETPEDALFCATFHPDADRVMGWLMNTWPVPPRWVADDVFSPCVITAEVTMADGGTAILHLQSSGAGSLRLADGEIRNLFGPLFWHDPFGGPYFNLD